MVEIDRTSDPVRLSFLRSVLNSADIQNFVFEPNVGGLWPGAVSSRLMVTERDEAAARRAIQDADPGEIWR